MDTEQLQARISELEKQNQLLAQKLTLLDLPDDRLQMERIMRTREQFLLNMSHEIRTPMNSIVGFTGLLMKTKPTPEQVEYIDAIRASGENLLVIINDILDFSKMQAGKVHFEKIAFSLVQIISSVVDQVLPLAAEKDLKLFFSIDTDTPIRLIGDPTRLCQVLLNLTVNAVKFTEEGQIKLSVRKLSESERNIKLEFAVSDTGIGIPDNNVTSIFEEFTQVSGDVTRKYGGAGLGLAIVRQLVEAQGGQVSVKSKVGQGSVFTFSLLFGKEDAPAAETTIKRAAEGEAAQVVEGLNVLLVEDNTLNQKLAMKIIGDWNWQVDLADTGVKALRKLKRKNYDVILMDVQLPDMDGYETTAAIRNELSAPKRYTPIIALTAHAMNTEQKKCQQAGMNGYISKPFNPRRLYNMVLSVIRKGRDLQEIKDKSTAIPPDQLRDRSNRTKMK